jgi:hypothetical protein
VRAGRKKEGSGSDKAAIIGSSRYVLCTMNLNRGMCKILVGDPSDFNDAGYCAQRGEREDEDIEEAEIANLRHR